MQSRTFYPESGDPNGILGPNGWLRSGDPEAPRIHVPLQPSTDTAAPSEPHYRLRAMGLGLVFALLGGVFYVSLFVLTGQEVLAASLMIGLLAGAGMRLGGARDRWSVAFAASAMGTVMWGVASAGGKALLVAIDPSADATVAMTNGLVDTAGMLASPSADSLIAVIAVGLIMAGAVVSTALFTKRRSRRSPQL
ncbi:hypothetical protein [Demequina sp. NBRC 110056]|uniref:hypothetical protein n=1 Tax=Demequina sp. NBRC 110056 TaxID=1570345 RepID=UPI000A024220|nr:hypothetical protein [Demequina sp. NBRC 110056]